MNPHTVLTQADMGPNFRLSVMFLHVNPFPNKPLFLRVWCTSLENTVGIAEIAISLFSISLSVFYPCGDVIAIFIELKNVVRKTLSVLNSLKFVVWKRVNKIFLDLSKLKALVDDLSVISLLIFPQCFFFYFWRKI